MCVTLDRYTNHLNTKCEFVGYQRSLGISIQRETPRWPPYWSQELYISCGLAQRCSSAADTTRNFYRKLTYVNCIVYSGRMHSSPRLSTAIVRAFSRADDFYGQACSLQGVCCLDHLSMFGWPNSVKCVFIFCLGMYGGYAWWLPLAYSVAIDRLDHSC